MPTVPLHELDLLDMTVEEAVELAAAGAREDGYDALLGGLCRAEGLEAEHHPWAGELTARWRDALEQFCTMYAVRRR